MSGRARPSRSLAAPAIALTAFLAFACGGAQIETQDVVSAIPWADGETAQYRLEDRDGQEKGGGDLKVQRAGDSFVLELRFFDDLNYDETRVTVDATTLKPVRVSREIGSQDQEDTIEAEYTGDQVRIEASSDGDRRQSFLRIPEHSYDNDSSLFLWRTLPFAEGYEASYNAVLTNRRKNEVVTVRVAGIEELEVPMGTFQAWRVEVRAGGVRQVAWYTTDERRLLVKYDNSRLVFLLADAFAGD